MDILPMALSEYWLLNMFDVWQVIFYVKCETLHKNTYTTKDTTLCEVFAVLFVTLHTSVLQRVNNWTIPG